MAQHGATWSDALSNTKMSASRPQQRINWCFTYNNYEKNDIYKITERLNEISKLYVFQEEIGENGIPHLQGVVSLKKRMRCSEFKLPKEIHWEECKSLEDSIQYCQKEDIVNNDCLIMKKFKSL